MHLGRLDVWTQSLQLEKKYCKPQSPSTTLLASSANRPLHKSITMASPTATSPATTGPGSMTSSTPLSPATPSSSSSPTNLYLENDPARTGYDPQRNSWLNIFLAYTHRMTPEGAFHLREAIHRDREARDVSRAESYRDWLFQYSPTITFLNDRIAELNHGRRLDASNVVCRRCPGRITPGGVVERQSGGFEPKHGILVCANEVRDRGHLEDTLAHEMVHAYDELRWEVDFRGERDLRQAACTEVGSHVSFPRALGRSALG